jgi:hypothetical protein
VRLLGLSPVTTPKSLDFVDRLAMTKPSAARPRFNNSRTAAARLGIRVLNRQSSTAFSSSSVSMICKRSPRLSSPMTHPSLWNSWRIMQNSLKRRQVRKGRFILTFIIWQMFGKRRSW